MDLKCEESTERKTNDLGSDRLIGNIIRKKILVIIL